jgi:hypothetical protein
LKVEQEHLDQQQGRMLVQVLELADQELVLEPVPVDLEQEQERVLVLADQELGLVLEQEHQERVLVLADLVLELVLELVMADQHLRVLTVCPLHHSFSASIGQSQFPDCGSIWFLYWTLGSSFMKSL